MIQDEKSFVKNWFRDWRKIAEALPEGTYEPIFARLAKTEYEVLLLSRYDDHVDGNRKVVLTPARHFDNHVAQLSRRTRDVGIVRVITFTGKPRYVLEPGLQAADWGAAMEGVSIDVIKSAMRESLRWRSVCRREKKPRLESEQLQQQIASLLQQIFESEDGVELLQRELKVAKRELSLLQSE